MDTYTNSLCVTNEKNFSFFLFQDIKKKCFGRINDPFLVKLLFPLVLKS